MLVDARVWVDINLQELNLNILPWDFGRIAKCNFATSLLREYVSN